MDRDVPLYLIYINQNIFPSLIFTLGDNQIVLNRLYKKNNELSINISFYYVRTVKTLCCLNFFIKKIIDFFICNKHYSKIFK